MPLGRLALAALPVLLRRRPRVGGVQLYHVRRLGVHVDQPVEVTLDGEIAGRLPGDSLLAAEALRVVTGPRFIDIDDADAAKGSEREASDG